MGYIMIGIFAALGSAFIVLFFIQNPGVWPPLGLWGLLLAFAFFIGMGCVLSWRSAPNAHWVEVGSTGVTFGFPHGRTRSYLWRDSRFLLILSRTEAWTGGRTTHPLWLNASGRWRNCGRLTVEAYDALLQEARLQNLRVSGGNPGRYGAVLTYITPN